MLFSSLDRSVIHKTWSRFRKYSDRIFWSIMIVLNLLIPLLFMISVME